MYCGVMTSGCRMTALTQAADKARTWTRRRDQLIREQRKAGRSLRAIAADVGLSHSAIAKIEKMPAATGDAAAGGRTPERTRRTT